MLVIKTSKPRITKTCSITNIGYLVFSETGVAGASFDIQAEGACK